MFIQHLGFPSTSLPVDPPTGSPNEFTGGDVALQWKQTRRQQGYTKGHQGTVQVFHPADRNPQGGKTSLVGEKWWSESQLGRIIYPIYYGEINHAPNHQPDNESNPFKFFFSETPCMSFKGSGWQAGYTSGAPSHHDCCNPGHRGTSPGNETHLTTHFSCAVRMESSWMHIFPIFPVTPPFILDFHGFSIAMLNNQMLFPKLSQQVTTSQTAVDQALNAKLIACDLLSCATGERIESRSVNESRPVKWDTLW